MHAQSISHYCILYLSTSFNVGSLTFSVLHRVCNSLLSHFNIKFPCLESTTFIFSKGLVGSSTLLYYRSFQNCIYVYLNGFDVRSCNYGFDLYYYYLLHARVCNYVSCAYKTHFLVSLMAKQSSNDCYESSACTVSVKIPKQTSPFYVFNLQLPHLNHFCINCYVGSYQNSSDMIAPHF